MVKVKTCPGNGPGQVLTLIEGSEIPNRPFFQPDVMSTKCLSAK